MIHNIFAKLRKIFQKITNFAEKLTYLIILMLVNNTGLVLEGGGMRGIFTIGVLDAFIEYGVMFPYSVGVSAGACNGPSFVTGQKGRARFSNVGMIEKHGHNYLGVRMLLKSGNIFNVPLLYDELPNKIWPFEYDKFFDSETEFELVTTNMLTGEANYFSNREPEFDQPRTAASRRFLMDLILASSSLPYVSKHVSIRDIPMLDGGIVDSIPVERAMKKGFDKNIIVLTRNKGYRKVVRRGRIIESAQSVLRNFKYSKYPEFCNALSQRGAVYNRQLELVDELERQGKAIVIRPEKPIVVDRIERNPAKLNALYDEGYEIGVKFCKRYFVENRNQH